VDLYIHYPIRIHGVVLNLLSTGTTFSMSLLYLRIIGFFGLYPSSGILESRKHILSETGSVSVLK
jgi:hypothetical protein